MTTINLLDLPGITNPAILVHSLGELKRYFAKIGQKPPNLPPNITSYMPFRLLITEDIDETGKLNHCIQFIKPDGSIAYQNEWLP